MLVRSERVLITAVLLGLGTSGVALGQTPAAPPAAPPAVAPAPPSPASDPATAVAQPLAPANTSAPPQASVPSGYMLVPIPTAPAASAETRYDVEYPQGRGALPPGMELPYEDGDPIPEGYRLRHVMRRGLVIAGSIVTGAPWAMSVTGAVGADFEDNSGFLLVPVLGPWLMLATGGAKDDPCDESGYGYCGGGNNAGLRAMLVLDGLAQTAGAVMFITGVVFPRKRLVRSDVTISLAPSPVGQDGYGVGAIGTF